MTDSPWAFEISRPKLLRTAYRMLGSITEAEDVVQEAFLRWIRSDRSDVEQPEAFLRRIVMRLCLDHKSSARSRREDYFGLWLPEPEVEGTFDENDGVTLPLMLALERLTPLERAAFLLHDVFGLSFSEVASTIDRDPVNCRQLAKRARHHIRSERSRFDASRQRGLELAEAFFAASRDGDMEMLRRLLAEDVAVYADGGGKVPTIMASVNGIEDSLRLFEGLGHLFERSRSHLLSLTYVCGLPGFVTREEQATLQTTALRLAGDLIAEIYVTRNPDKLRHIAASVH